MFDVKKIKQEFPILQQKINGKPFVFLDSASTSQKPRQVIDAIKDYYEKFNANPHRAIYKLSEEATELYENSRKKIADFINAKQEEIIFVRNTNEAINLVMYSWALNNLKKGDEILTTTMEHHANIVPWQFLQKNRVKLKFVDIDDAGLLKMEEYKKINNSTKLVTVTHASNVLGTINDIKLIGKLAHDNDSMFLVDGAQSIPHMEIDVKEIGCDFFAFSGHKMLAPMNIGVLYARKEILENMEPFMRGSDMIKTVSTSGATWNDSPWKFEAGTPNVEGAVGLSAAIDYLEKIGMSNVRQHEKELVQYALKKLSDIDGINIYGPSTIEIRGSVMAFNVDGTHAHDVAQILDSEGIAIRSGHHCCQPLMRRLGIEATARASFYIYNSKDDVDKLVDALGKVKKVFKK